jgi:hypothetical protein
MFRIALALTVVLAALANSASAADNKLAVINVNNGSKDLTLNFEYRWGNGKWESVKDLKPGRTMTLWHPLDAKGQAPNLQVRMNRAIGNAKPITKTFDLTWAPAAKATASTGKQYEIARDLIDRQYVWLAERNR